MKKEIKKLVGKGRLQEAIDLFISISDENDNFFNQILHTQFRLNKINHQNVLGTISFDEYNRYLNQVSDALLGLVDLMPDEYSNPNIETKEESSLNLSYTDAIEFIKSNISRLEHRNSFMMEFGEGKSQKHECRIYPSFICSENGFFKLTINFYGTIYYHNSPLKKR